MKKTIAVFDFDGTITNKDTFMDFIVQSCGFRRLCFGGIKSLPIMFFFGLRAVSADIAKEKIFACFLKGMPEIEFNSLCENYALSQLPKILKKQALEKIEWHRKQGHKLVVVSASLENWIKPWAETSGFEKVIATMPEIKNGILTGKFKTKNCNREEKPKRFLTDYPDRKDYYLYVYGDSRKDKWLLVIADERFYRRF